VLSFAINNPIPSVTSVDPDSASAGGSGQQVTVSGSGFVQGSVVRWNGVARTTTYVGPSQLTATLTSADLAAETTATITVFNPTPGGGTSGGVSFTVGAPGLQTSDQIVVDDHGGAPIPRSRLVFSATTGSLEATSVSFIIRRADDGLYWNAATHAWEDESVENSAIEEGATWNLAVSGADRRLFVDCLVDVEVRAVAAGLPYQGLDIPRLSVR
jgi:hypothetical protein